MKKLKRMLLLFGACSLLVQSIQVKNVYAYDYQKPSAYQAGTVTITALGEGNSVNGFSTLGGYQVDYSVTDSFLAFDPANGCDFYIGNDLNPTGGCHFAYKPNGVIWEQGALNLGAIYDGKVVGSAQPDVNNTVHISFRVSDLSELPNFICYTYQPTGTFLHITPEYPGSHHVWYYQTLKNNAPVNTNTIDTTAPNVSATVAAAGNTVNTNQKTWGTRAVITATAKDAQSRPGGIRFYQNGGEIRHCQNGSNATNITGKHEVTANGTYQVKAYDQLGNESGVQTVTVDCIDTTAPAISSFRINQGGYCTSAVLSVAATDQGCGLSEAAYSFNNGSWTKSNQITVTENGTYQVRVRDALGNISSQSITVQNIDVEKPKLLAEVKEMGDTVTTDGVSWSLKKNAHVTVTDGKSGIEKVTIACKEAAYEKEYLPEENQKKEWSFETDSLSAGTYVICAYDQLGNTEQGTIEIRNVDDMPPVIKSVEQEKISDETIRIIVTADDGDGSGLPEEAYSFDGGNTWQKDNFLDVQKNDTYEIVVRDCLGLQNQTRENVDQIKEHKEPTHTGDNPDDGNGDNPGDQSEGNPNNPTNPAPGNVNQTNTQTNNVQNNKDLSHKKNDSDDRDKNKKTKETNDSKDAPYDYENFHEENLSDLKKDTVNQEKTAKMKETLSDHELNDKEKLYDLEKQQNKITASEKKVQKIAAVVLIAIFIAGLSALGLYLLLSAMHNSCILFEIGDHNEKKRLARLFLKTISDDWLIEVPDYKLGDFGTGRYRFVFRTAFVKENEGDYVVITIDKNRIREKLREEIDVHIS